MRREAAAGDTPSINPSFRSRDTPWELEGGEAKDEETSEEPQRALFSLQDPPNEESHGLLAVGVAPPQPWVGVGRTPHSGHYCSPCPLQ